ncbi:CBF-domain-containing protein [Ceraceosorus guamensis]|uniref:CBF-domain-containing protein n=1 Tax=Ceraceosorus guamensis TaxID=1522189 RepID=A0A316W5W7_9BASI|nr:CBF-domain-containing protein [Ceraceosorus guamensis]PWN44488.1 CBF-domain-containing protein [Ceraceosorus guamensis]
MKSLNLQSASASASAAASAPASTAASRVASDDKAAKKHAKAQKRAEEEAQANQRVKLKLDVESTAVKSTSEQVKADPVVVKQDWKAEREAKKLQEKRDKAAAAAVRAQSKSDKAAEAKQSLLASSSTQLNGIAPRNDSRLVFAPQPHWAEASMPQLPPATIQLDIDDSRILSLQSRAKQLLDGDNSTYRHLLNGGHIPAGGLGSISNSDAKFISSLLGGGGGGGSGSASSGGTLSDRIAALTLLIQSSPLHNVHSMEALLGMAGKKNREESRRATRALADWFASPTGLCTRKLRYFRDQPGLAAILSDGGANIARTAQDQHLIHYAFEDKLKKIYFDFLQLLQTQSHDTLPFVRKQAVTQIYVLLRDKAEQEQNLLRLLSNKLGDGDRSVASQSSKHLQELLTVHPNMKAIVVREVIDIILKPAPKTIVSAEDKSRGRGDATQIDGTASAAAAAAFNVHARYYGILTLNQTLLTQQDEEVASTLVNLYFELFESLLHYGAAVEQSKADEEQQGEEEKSGSSKDQRKVKKQRWRDEGGRGKGRRGKGKKGGGQGKNDTMQFKTVKDADVKMVTAVLTGVRRALPFSTLGAEAFDKHMSTLFRITHSGTFNVSIQALQLIYQLSIGSSSSSPIQTQSGSSKQDRGVGQGAPAPNSDSAFPSMSNIADRYYTVLYSSMLDARLSRTNKQAMYLNLVFKSLKADEDDKRCKAMVKRLLQVTLSAEAPWICGTLFLLAELLTARPGLRALLTEPEDDEEEHFVDVPDEDEEALTVSQSGQKDTLTTTTTTTKSQRNLYDPSKPHPQFAGAESTCLWEIVPLLHHHHPSVSFNAHRFLSFEGMLKTTGDLTLNTLSHFLDRFVYRNPKKALSSSKGPSAMQPAAAAVGTGGSGTQASVVRIRGKGMERDQVLNEESFWKGTREEEIDPDQLFFHRFFNLKEERQGIVNKGKKKRAQEEEEEEEEEEGEGADGSEDGLVLEGEESDEDVEEEGDAQRADGVMDSSDEDDSQSEGEKEIWEAMKRTMPREEGDEDLMQDSQDDDEDLDQYDYVDSGEEEEGEEEKGWVAGKEDEDDDEDEDLSGLEEDEENVTLGGESDDDALLFEEDEDDLLPFHNFDSEQSIKNGRKRSADDASPNEEEDGEGEEAAAAAGQEKGRKSKSQLQRAERKRRKAQHAAMGDFASAEDYAHLLGDDQDEDEDQGL